MLPLQSCHPVFKYLFLSASVLLCIVIVQSFVQSYLIHKPFAMQLFSDKRNRVPPTVTANRTQVYMSNCDHDKVLCGINEEQQLAGGAQKENLQQLKQKFHKLMTNANREICPNQRRFGNRAFGYEVCLAEPFRPRPHNCLVYSFGIGRDWSFDAAVGKYGCEVHSFDPSIGRRDGKLAPNVSFHAVGLWGSDIVNSRGWRLNKLSTIRNKLGHTHRILDVLKVDVEIAEWPFLRNIVDEEPWQLTSVRQIIFEVHSPTFRSQPGVTANNMLEIIHYFQRLEKLGFVLFLERRMETHDNGCCGRFRPFMPAGIREKCCYETLYVNTGKVVAA